MKKILLFLWLSSLFSISLFASGDPDRFGYNAVEGEGNWSYEIDLSELDEGTYNFIIRGKDKAGNETLEGPYNIQVDAESDLPLVSISNPTSGMRIGTSLVVLGTANDDDEVASVHIKIDIDGAWQKAEGTNFWSFALDLDSIPDGEHTLYARSTDINGVEGEEITVDFVLDKTNPQSRFLSHTSGEMVNGRITLEGTIEDPNGIDSFYVSADDGETFENVNFRYDKTLDIYNFGYNVDTTDYEDGPQVFWFRAVDKTGSIGYVPFCVYIDNDGPEIEFLSPNEDNDVASKFSIIGRLFDEVGVTSLHYRTKFTEEPIEIPLQNGDPNWYQVFDYSDNNESRAEIFFIVEDKAGNVKEVRQVYKIDRDLGKPVLEALWPLESGEELTFEDNVQFFGFFNSKNDIEKIRYIIDRSAPEEISAQDAFSIELRGLSEGEHSITIIGIDKLGLESEELKREFFVAKNVNSISLDSILVGETQKNWIPGSTFDPVTGGTIYGSIVSEGRVTLTLTETINGIRQESRSISVKASTTIENGYEFSIPVKKKSISGFYELELIAVSSNQESLLLESGYYVEESVYSEDGKTIVDSVFPVQSSFELPFSNIDEDGRVLISDSMPLYGWIGGTDIESAVLSISTNVINLDVQNGIIIIEKNENGVTEPFTIIVTDENGTEWSSDTFIAVTDRTKPEMISFNFGDNIWKKNDLLINGELNDSSELAIVEYSIDGSQYRVLTNNGTGGSFTFEEEILLNSISDGAFLIHVRVIDIAGNTSNFYYPVVKDSEAPTASVKTPLADDIVFRLSTLAGIHSDNYKLETILFSFDGENWTEVQYSSDSYFQFLDLSIYGENVVPEDLEIKLIDKSGNETIVSALFVIDQDANKPILSVQTPAVDSSMKTDFSISGLAFDDDGIGSIYYRFDKEGDFVRIDGDISFEIDMALLDLTEADHILEVKAEDSGGIESDITEIFFRVSHKEPFSTLLTETGEHALKGDVLLEGTSEDLNGIKEVFISIDNGSSWQLVNGTEEWNWTVDTTLLEDGLHSFLLKSIDYADTIGYTSFLINIDNSAPIITLDTPGEGNLLNESLSLQGRVFDANLSSLNMAIEKNGTVVMEDTLPLRQVFFEDIDISNLENGSYTLKLTASDSADNITFMSRVIELVSLEDLTEVTLSYPLSGSDIEGYFSIEGRVTGEVIPEKVVLTHNGELFDSLDVDANGWYRRDISPEDMIDGDNIFIASVTLENGDEKISEESLINYKADGAWLTIDSHNSGTFITERPWLEGRMGYEFIVSENDPETGEPILSKEQKKELKNIMDAEVLVSMDNGRSFEKATTQSGTWKFRLETQDYLNGELGMIVRAVFGDGTVVQRQVYLEVDKIAPNVELFNKEIVDGHYNNSLDIMGIAGDNNDLESVEVTVRDGNLKNYQVPSFIQGMYLDAHFIGATTWDIGIGLSFFDDNVKLQAQIGWAPSTVTNPVTKEVSVSRFNGLVIGFKLLANIASIPLSSWFGPDWEPFSITFALGANFSYFTMSGDQVAFTDDGKIIGGVVGQVEIPKIRFRNNTFLTYISTYFEAQLWFIPSDVEATVLFRPSFGIRAGLF